MLHHYGTGMDKILEDAADKPDLLAPIGGSAVIAAQAVHAVRNEMAQNLADIVFRRTDLATGAYPGQGALNRIAAAVGPMLGWDEVATAAEIEAVKGRFPKRAVLDADRAVARDNAAA